MPRLYSVPIDNVTLSATSDLAQLNPASNKPIRFAGLFLWQTTDVGDAQEEWLRFTVIRRTGTTSNGTGGTSVTPQPIGATGQSAGFTVNRSIASASQGSGTDTVVMPLAMNIRAGIELLLPPELRPDFIHGDTTLEAGMIIRVPVAPNSSISLSGFIAIEEEG